jgi:hypothetical protein
MAPPTDLQRVKQEMEIRAIRRRESLAAISDYMGFAVAKISGLGLSSIGILEIVSPDRLHLALSHPSAIAGAGLTLLGGPQVAKILTELLKVFE